MGLPGPVIWGVRGLVGFSLGLFVPSSFLLVVLRPGAPFVASDRSVLSDARSPSSSFLGLVEFRLGSFR